MKIKEFQKYLNKNKIDFAFLITKMDVKDKNFYYFTQLQNANLEFGILVIPKVKKPFVLAMGFEFKRVKDFNKSGINVIELKKTFMQDIQKIVGKPKKIGINMDIITINGLKRLKKQFKCKYVDINGICIELREQKTAKEIENIKTACKKTDDVIQKCFKNFANFKTEEDVVNFLREETEKYKYCEFAFDPIVASGSNGAYPHHQPTSEKLKKGFCVIDFGIKYKGYHADMTRTIYLGVPTKQEIDDYFYVLHAQKKSIEKIKMGTKFSDLMKTSQNVLGERKKYFIHNLGHGIGLSIHEEPSIYEESKKKIKENMIFTIEPGIYMQGKYGIRIEEDVLMTKKGPVVLTKTGKNLLIIKK